MKQLVLALLAQCFIQLLPAQEVTYVLFNRDCMNQLEYRYSYPNVKGDSPVWAYSIKPNVLENFIFMTEGAGYYSPEMPAGTVSCRNLALDDALVSRINRGGQQMLVVFQRQSGGYWLMPVASATLIARNNQQYWVRTPQSSFQFDTTRLVNEQNLAVVGSPTAAYFSGAKVNSCLLEYTFHCEPVKAGELRADLQVIPSIGIINDRTGKSASQAMESELQLVKVNGKALGDYVTANCPENSGKIVMSKTQKMTGYGDPKFEADKEIASIMKNEQEAVKPVEHTTPPSVTGIACADAWEQGTHIVQKGENLRAIARTYKVSVTDLVKWNNIANPDMIEVCQKIWLKSPPTSSGKGASPQTYDIQPVAGQTVTKQGPSLTQKGTQTAPPRAQNLAPARPQEYNTEAYGENNYSTFKGETNTPLIHTVSRGDYLYKIAKIYGCPEECIRIANAMPLEGDEPLKIGQEIIIPACTCTVNGQAIKRTAVPEPSAPKVTKQGIATPKGPYTGTLRPQSSILDVQTPATYNTEDTPAAKAANPSLWEETSLYDTVSKTGEKAPAMASAKKAEAAKVPLFREHHVKQGENLQSIAVKYKVNAFELSQVNGVDAKEALIPGKTILVPIMEE